jgi:hypothetical protein
MAKSSNGKLGASVIWLVGAGLFIISGMIGQISGDASWAGIGVGVTLIVVALLITADKSNR